MAKNSSKLSCLIAVAFSSVSAICAPQAQQQHQLPSAPLTTYDWLKALASAVYQPAAPLPPLTWQALKSTAVTLAPSMM